MLRHSDFDRALQYARVDLARLKLKTALAQEALSRKGYDPKQPRNPAGQPNGGRWMGDTGPEASNGRQSRPSSRISLAQNPQELCNEQYKRDVFQCKMVGLRSCYAQAMVRLVACERGHDIPPLNY